MAIKPDFFNWYDYESTGLSPHHDQVIQASIIRTDAELNLIKGAELNLLIKPRPDVVPGPKAFAVHGISMEQLNREGISEFEAAAHLKSWFGEKPKSMMGGFNTIGFDDEFTRNTLYRSLHDPYEHEWKNGNSRTDIMRLAMFVYALRPHLMNVIPNSKGEDSLKLEDLCKANGIVLDNAHDARSDVVATIDLARHLKHGSPQMWQYFLNLSGKDFTKPMIDKLEPLVLVDRYLGREKRNVTMTLPIIYDANVNTKMLSVDLREDPTVLLSLSVEELKRRIFTRSEELKEGESIKSIRDITINKLPLIAEPSIFKNHPDVVDRAGLDLDACMQHAEMIKKDKGFRDRLQQAYVADYEPCSDVYKGIYSLGFISNTEASMRVKARTLEPQVDEAKRLPGLVNLNVKEFSKTLPEPLRMHELGLRAKWANYGEEVINRDTFTSAEITDWIDHLKRVWHGPAEDKLQINLDGYKASLADVRASTALDERQEQSLVELEAHVAKTLTLIDELSVIASIKRDAEVAAAKAAEAVTSESPETVEQVAEEADAKPDSEDTSSLKVSRSTEAESSLTL